LKNYLEAFGIHLSLLFISVGFSHDEKKNNLASPWVIKESRTTNFKYISDRVLNLSEYQNIPIAI